MTHTLHRQGAPETFKKDYILLSMPAKGYNTPGSREKLVQIIDIALKHNPINMGDTQQGNMYSIGVDELKKRIKDGGVLNITFATKEDLTATLKEVREADLGMSVVATGLFEHTAECCGKAGLERHTIASAVGVWGKTELLPEAKYLRYMTMCGHGLLTVALIDHLVAEVKAGRLTLEQAGKEMAKPCVCGIINPVRASELLTEFM